MRSKVDSDGVVSVGREFESVLRRKKKREILKWLNFGVFVAIRSSFPVETSILTSGNGLVPRECGLGRCSALKEAEKNISIDDGRKVGIFGGGKKRFALDEQRAEQQTQKKGSGRRSVLHSHQWREFVMHVHGRRVFFSVRQQ